MTQTGDSAHDRINERHNDFSTVIGMTMQIDYIRIVARLDRKRLGAQFRGEEESRSEAFSKSRLEGSRWRLRRAREMRLAMEFEWVFFRLLFGAKRECRHFQGCGQERQIPPHTWRIISRAASAAPAASFLPVIREGTAIHTRSIPVCRENQRSFPRCAATIWHVFRKHPLRPTGLRTR